MSIDTEAHTTPNPPLTENSQPAGTSTSDTIKKHESKGQKSNRYKRGDLNSPLKDFVGLEKDFGLVLGLSLEYVDAKAPFDTFREKLNEYVMKKLKHPTDIQCVLQDLKCPKEKFREKHMPEDLEGEDAKSKKLLMLQDSQMKLYAAREMEMRDNLVRIYSYVWGQCTPGLQAEVMAHEDFKSYHEDKDPIWLLMFLKLTTAGLDNKGCKYENCWDAMSQLITMKQYKYETNDDFMERYRNQVQVVKLAGAGNFFECYEAIGHNNPSDDKKKACVLQMEAMGMFKAADNRRYGDYKKEVKNNRTFGRDDFPKNINELYNHLVRHSKLAKFGKSLKFEKFGSRFRKDRSNIMFVQHADRDEKKCFVPGLDGKINTKYICHYCGEPGHGKYQCPHNPDVNQKGDKGTGKNGISNLMMGYLFAQNKLSPIPSTWVLLDTCSTSHVSNNAILVSNIVDCPPQERLCMTTNGGKMTYTQTATLNILPVKVHFNPQSMATILSLAGVDKLPWHYCTMDTRASKAIHVHKPNGDTLVFKPCADGLYYYDTAKPDDHSFKSKPKVTDYSLLQTVNSNKSFFTKKEIEGAMKARKEQEILSWPPTQTYKSYVSDDLIANSKVTNDVNRASLIWGEPEPLIAGNMVRTTPQAVKKIERVPLPLPIKIHHSEIQLHVDFFFVNWIPFLHTKSAKLNFLTVERMKTRTKGAIIEAMKDVLRL